MDQANASETFVVSLDAAMSLRRLRSLNPNRPIDELTVSGGRLFDQKQAREVSSWQPIRKISLWTTTTKAALRQLLVTAGVEELNVLRLSGHGSLKGMPKPETLHTFRCGSLSSEDVREIAGLPGLRILGAQYSSLSHAAVSRLVGTEALADLDLEGSDLTDELAAILSASSKIVSLAIGASRVGPAGLESICRMAQLRELDIWGLRIQEGDLDCLGALGNLEYLSVGGHQEQTVLTAKGVLSRIARLPSLKRLWLDGIAMTKDEAASLERRYDRVRIT
jgi:hypothetical protein